MTVGVNGTQVDIYCPLKRLASADLVVAMDPTQLAAVFEFLQEVQYARDSLQEEKVQEAQ